MSPEAQHLESFFTPADGGAGASGLPSAEQEEVAEFTRFFERLSAIDDMTWFSPEETGQAAEAASEAPAGQPRPRAGDALRNRRPAANRAPATPMEPATPQPEAPGMQVFRSEPATPRIGAGQPVRPASQRVAVQPRPIRPDPAPQAGEETIGGFNRTMRQVGRALGVALLGSVLFAAGLGMGALVLSIPKTTSTSFDSTATPAEATDATQPAAVQLVPATPGDGKAGEMVAPEVPSLVEETPAVARSTRPRNSAAAPVAKPAAPATAANAAPPAKEPTAAVPAAAGGNRFALQVGACGSFQCVQQFRELLLGHVSSDTIQVVAAGNGADGTLQRVRVEPLSREAAEELKATLAGVDARFAQAYLVALK